MTVSARHQRLHGLDVAVIEGIATRGAFEHLCRTLSVGAAFDADAVVVDLSLAADVSDGAAEQLSVAARSFERNGRWLAVVDPLTVGCGDDAQTHVYRSTRDALAAAGRYFRLVTGARPLRPATTAIAGAASGVLWVVPQLAHATVSGVIDNCMRWANRRRSTSSVS